MSVLSDLDALILRSKVHPPLITKGSELTYDEWDTHVTALYDAVQSIVSGVNVTAYDAGTTYDDSSSSIYEKYAGYDSRIWKAIGTFTGQTPEEGLYWTQVTLAELLPDVLNIIDRVENCSCTLDDSYDAGGAGAGREIDAVDGAVKISGTDGLLVTGTFGSGAAAEISGAGTRMFFNPAKAAFRAGTVTGTEWDDSNIGDYSIALGGGNTASGESSISVGNGNTASGDKSMSLGTTCDAIGERSVAIGDSSITNALRSVAIGLNLTSESYAETSIGLNNTDYTPTSTSAWSATDRLFVIGNGQSDVARADALIITKDGNLTMPTTTGAFSPPVLTTTERNALTPTAGMMIFNSTDSKHQGYDGSIWNDLY